MLNKYLIYLAEFLCLFVDEHENDRQDDAASKVYQVFVQHISLKFFAKLDFF